jgi:TRAP-type C4-dicarboxylate transport system permease small subunit
LKTLNRISEVLNKVCSWFLILAFAVMTVTYFGQIVLRYVFQTGLRWTEELTRYTNIALVMVGSAVMAGKNAHINVSALEMSVSPKIKKWIVIFQQLITATFFGIAILIALDMISLAGTQVSTNMRIPMKIVYGIFPVAFSILLFQVLVFILNQLTSKEDA